MKYPLILFAAVLLLWIISFAQAGVGINTSGAEDDPSAMLDVSSAEKGVLIPRMTEAERNAIVNPSDG